MQRYTNLFSVLWACLVTRTQDDSSILQKTLLFICMPKTNFFIHFFLETLHFKESCSWTGWQHFGPYLVTPNFARYGISDEIKNHVKNQKKLGSHSWGKCRTDGRTDRQTNGETDYGDYIGHSVGRGSNY